MVSSMVDSFFNHVVHRVTGKAGMVQIHASFGQDDLLKGTKSLGVVDLH